MRILVAEDERITRMTLVRQLESWGHTVTAAEDGELARSAFETAEFDLVVTDWEMPNLSGLDLIRHIRATPRAGYVYLIMLTSRSDKGDIVSGIEAGADDFVSKPFDREELRVRILAGERVVRLERDLSTKNTALQNAADRMRKDLRAAARVQRAMLPKTGLDHERVHASFRYVPTDELAGDALGFFLIDDRFLVSYVVDVTGHGVPAALLAVTVMHALSPTGEGALLARAPSGETRGVHSTSKVITELNRRFCAGDNDGRFLTMILATLDIREGRLRFTRAGHPLPFIMRGPEALPVDEAGGLPLGITDTMDYDEVEVQLQPNDRVYLYSDGIIEQLAAAASEEFGDRRLKDLLAAGAAHDPPRVIQDTIAALEAWAGKSGRVGGEGASCFADDVSMLAVDWRG